MNFDEKAKEWDNNPANVERAFILSNEIRDFIKPSSEKGAFDFGCGTGLLSYYLKDDFKSITLADTSVEMLKVLEKKIENEGINNFSPFLMDLTGFDFQDSGKYDVIYTSMVLHHIPDISSLMKKFNSMLNEDGYLFISDLITEDGRFHSYLDDFTGHNGFSRDEMENYLRINGFETVNYKIILDIEKIFENNEIKKYPVFLITAKKNK